MKINTRRTPATRVEENEVQEEIPDKVEELEQAPQVSQGAQGDQVPIVGWGNDVPKLTNRDIREALLALARA